MDFWGLILMFLAVYIWMFDHEGRLDKLEKKYEKEHNAIRSDGLDKP